MLRIKLITNDNKLKNELSLCFAICNDSFDATVIDADTAELNIDFKSPCILLAASPELFSAFSFDYVIKKPFSPVMLQNAITLLLSADRDYSSFKKDSAVSLLKSFGIEDGMKGFEYVVEAVLSVSGKVKSGEKPSFSDVYSHIGNSLGVTPASVERAIRTYIEKVFRKGNIDRIFEIFGNSQSPDKGKCTNAEFICRLAERLNSEK